MVDMTNEIPTLSKTVPNSDLDSILSTVSFRLDALRRNLQSVFLGGKLSVDFVIMSLISGESILIEDVPGVGKTTLAKALALSVDLSFNRVQCTQDLLPADIFGFSVLNQLDGSFSFRPGPIFCNMLLVDEINRASPRTQSALLEAMAEKQVTIEGELKSLDPPFFVVATQNPIGSQGTFPLPESQLDRFLLKFSLDYPNSESEVEMLYLHGRQSPVDQLELVMTLEDVRTVQTLVTQVKIERSLAKYLVTIVNETRKHPQIEVGCSPRGSLLLLKCAQSRALLEGRMFVLPDDIQNVAPFVLHHRIKFRNASMGGSNRETEFGVIEEILSSVQVPV